MKVFFNQLKTLQHNNISSALNFSHKLVLEVGASMPGGSLKISDYYENGDLCFISDNKSDTSLQLKENEKFFSNEEFVDRLAQAIVNACKISVEKIKEAKINKKEEEKLTDLTLLVPGVVTGKNTFGMNNLKTPEGNSLQNINIFDIENRVKEKALKDKIQVIDNFSITTLQDTIGASIYLAGQLLKSSNQV